MTDIRIKILETIDEMHAVEEVHRHVWVSGETDVIPYHLLFTIAHNGGLILGAYDEDLLVGYVFGFLAMEETSKGGRFKHASHELGILPSYRGQGIGYALKRAQWQMVRHQGLERITWTVDPLLSRNAHLNIHRLGAISNHYHRNLYGEMRDTMNNGLPSDRFTMDWWVNSPRVENRLSRRGRLRLDLAHYLEAELQIANPTRLGNRGLPLPSSPQKIFQSGGHHGQEAVTGEETQPILLVEIPWDYERIRREDAGLALEWRLHTRELFEQAFASGYLVTDFVHLTGTTPRSFYVLSQGDFQMAAF